MALVKQGDCLHNCLREVHLEKFHRNFIERGLTNCDQLGCLPMDQYSQFGIVSMDDRKRLFSIIEIIKSVKADGILCQHGTKDTDTDRKPEHGAVRKHEEFSKGAAVNENVKPATRIDNLGFAPKKLVYVEHENRRDEGKALVRPMNNYKVAVERSAEEDLKQKQMIKHGIVPGKNSDSPMFQCRKALNFSDPDLYSDEELQPTSKLHATQDGQTSVKVQYFYSTQANKKSVVSNGKVSRSSKDNRIGSGDAKDPSRRSNAVASSRSELIKREKMGERVSHQDSNTALTAARKNVEATTERVVASSRSTNVLPQHDRENVSSGNNNAFSSDSKTGANTNPSSSASSASSATAFSSTLAFNPKPNSAQQPSNVITKEFVSAPKHFAVDLKPSNEHEKSMRGFWQHPSKNTSDRNHAYFPAPEPVGPASKPIHVEQIIHSGGYNYGVPDGSSKTQNTTSQNYDDNNKSGNGILYPDKIRVCVRKRPRNAKELKRNDRDVVRIRGQQTVVVEEIKVAIDLTKYIHQHVLKFDEVFGDKCSNQEVYDRAVKPLITCVFDRGSAICFAFGQTGAGKTHTLMGSRTIPGMYQLAGEDLFAIAHSGRYREPLRLWVSFYEIYCGHLYDLLNKRKRLHVRENGKQKVCVAGLMENPVSDVDSLIKVISYGNSFRSKGSTGVNPHSSRSHALLQMDIRDAQEKKVGRLTFIDLAGSERASDATNLDRQTRIEGAEINQSLLALKECIRSIDQESGHTPYRQSKLTHILRDSFLGNSQTVMIANVSPTQTACENTLNTLRYADRVQELRKEVAVRTRRSTSPLNMAESHSNPTVPSYGPSSSASKRQAPSLFHPSDIQFSSTPMKNSSAASHVAPPVDLSDILVNGGESPLGGHKINRSRKSDAAEPKDQCSPISPIGELRPLHHGDDSVENKCKSNNGVAAAEGPVFSDAGRGPPCSSECRDISGEGSQARDPPQVVEVAMPCTCKSEKDAVGLKDLRDDDDDDDDLLREHRRIKTHAELVISRVKSVIAQAGSMPTHVLESNGLRNRSSDVPNALAFETQNPYMENARENIRDFLDNEKKSRVASEQPGMTNLQRQLGVRAMKSAEESEGVWTTRPDSRFHSSEEALPDETAPPGVEEETNETPGGNIEQMQNFNGNQPHCGSSSGSNLVSVADSNNPTKELRSWAAILQDSSDAAVKTAGSDINASGQQMGLRRDSVEEDLDVGRRSLGLFGVGGRSGEEDDGVEDGDEDTGNEEVPSFVISKEVRLLQMKIEELKMQKERLEREQRLFDLEDLPNDFQQFTETPFLLPSNSKLKLDSGAVLSCVSPTKMCHLSPTKRRHLSPTKRRHLSPGGDVVTVDLEMKDEQRVIETASSHISSPDQNGNFTKLSSRDPSEVEESRGKESCVLGGFRLDGVNYLESGDRTEGGEGRGHVWACQKEMGERTHDGGDRILFSGNKEAVLLFGHGVQGLSTDNIALKFPDDFTIQSNNSMPSQGSKCELGAGVPSARGERNALQDRDKLQTSEGGGSIIRNQNSAFTKVIPSTNHSANNSEQRERKIVEREETHYSQEEQFTLPPSTTRSLSLPISGFATTSFEPIESFPVTPRAGSESETNNRKGWNDVEEEEDGSSIDRSNSGMLEEAAVLERTRTLLVTAHEDQLTAVTHLCKQEMSLLMAFRTGQMDYDKYMESIRNILCTKSKIIEALVQHINEFHRTEESNS